MNTKTFIGLIATGLAIMPALSSSQVLGQNSPSVAQVQGSAMAQRARAAASQLTGIPAEGLSVVKESPLTDTGITRFKLTDAQGKIYGVSLDSAGNLVSQEALRQAVQTIANKGFVGKRERAGELGGQGPVRQAVQTIANKGFVGKLESELANRLGQESNSPINVVFYLKGAPSVSLRGNVQNRAQYEANLQTIKDRNAESQKAIVNQLRENGQRVIYQSAYASVVVAAVTPSLIQAIATRPDVERVYLERVAAPRLNVSRVVVQADTVNARGLTGSGQSVGVVEAQRIGNHPNLPPAQRILCRPEATTAISDHKTQVAGVIQSTALTNQGIAPAITIIDGIGANFSNSEMIAATDCVIANGASTINMSFGSETNGSFDAFARYVDEVVYNTGRTISVAVSNVCANKMGSPEIAFNVLAVGAFGDNNTPGFGDDIPACTGAVNFSAFLDPNSPHNDREEPDIVAPGHQILMPTNGGGFANNNGTSFAAPHVTGGGGLLVQRKPALFTQTEEVRADR